MWFDLGIRNFTTACWNLRRRYMQDTGSYLELCLVGWIQCCCYFNSFPRTEISSDVSSWAMHWAEWQKTSEELVSIAQAPCSRIQVLFFKFLPYIFINPLIMPFCSSCLQLFPISVLWNACVCHLCSQISSTSLCRRTLLFPFLSYLNLFPFQFRNRYHSVSRKHLRLIFVDLRFCLFSLVPSYTGPTFKYSMLYNSFLCIYQYISGFHKTDLLVLTARTCSFFFRYPVTEIN